MNTNELNESARKVFGKDINVMVARCKAWGNDDNCILIQGREHLACASGFVRAVRGAKVSSETSPAFMGAPAKTYSKVEWA